MPISIGRLRELIDLAASGGVDGVDLVEDGTHIRITRSGDSPLRRDALAAPPAAAPAPAAAAAEVFAAPMFGVFHLTPAPGSRPYVAAGDRVRKGQQLCLIEAMKMFNAIVSDRDGRIEAILAEAGSEVASGQPLFRITAG